MFIWDAWLDFSKYVDQNTLSALVIMIAILFLSIFVHEVGHFLWFTLVFKVPTSIVLDLKAFHAIGHIEPERYPDIRENTKWYIKNLKITAFLGNIQVIPLIELSLLVPDLRLYSYFLIIFFTVYSFYETFIKNHWENGWIVAAFNVE
ncbi:hypothetical protein JXL21_14205 [Candidatus Bathyarchaeota archaeon]|nr:hypothetical protein [Candidatus Bathyarchaeota archaeon]